MSNDQTNDKAKMIMPEDFPSRLTNAITDHAFKMTDDGQEEHVVINESWNIDFVPIRNQIEKPWIRIGTISSLNQNIPLFGGVRIAEVDNEIYEIDDGLNQDNRHEFANKFPSGDYKRTFIDSSFVDRLGLINHLKVRALKQNWYEAMITIAKREFGIVDES